MVADQETGLYYNWNNYYDPKIGRSITADRMSVAEHVQLWRANMGMPGQPPLEINPYVYAANNPLRWTDPTGEAAQAAVPVVLTLCARFPQACVNTARAIGAGIGAAVATVAEMCKTKVDEAECERRYEEVDVPVCRAISKRRGADAARRCYASASQRLAACLKGDPVPDLDTYNN